MSSVYDFEIKRLQGETESLAKYRGNVLLIVNTASKCGLTPQYKGLQALHDKFGEQGLTILGFPCNQFGAQEPGGEGDIASFCQLNYGVSFPMFAKLKVNGSETHPLYAYLKAEAPGLLGSQAIKWNFTKFLVDRDGNVIRRYKPTAAPGDLESDIAALL